MDLTGADLKEALLFVGSAGMNYDVLCLSLGGSYGGSTS